MSPLKLVLSRDALPSWILRPHPDTVAPLADLDFYLASCLLSAASLGRHDDDRVAAAPAGHRRCSTRAYLDAAAWAAASCSRAPARML